MKVLLRNVETGLYYAGPGTWTGDHSEARDFEQTNLALDHVSETGLRGMELLMRFDSPSLDIPLTIVGLGEPSAS